MRWTYLNEQSNSRKANTFYKKSIQVIKEMLDNKIDLMTLQPLLSDENDYARLDTACILLLFILFNARGNWFAYLQLSQASFYIRRYYA